MEVLVRLGRHREAAQALWHLESRAVGLRSPWLMMAVARSRAMLADGEQSLQMFNDALAGRNAQESLLERARTLLCYSERLNAFGRLRSARDGLARAKVMFDEAGAHAWAQHVDSLLLDERVERAGTPDNPAMLMLADHESRAGPNGGPRDAEQGNRGHPLCVRPYRRGAPDCDLQEARSRIISPSRRPLRPARKPPSAKEPFVLPAV